MREERGKSQVLFGMLPTQTIDLEGAIWQVEQWADPVQLPIDEGTLRAALRSEAYPWVGKDDGLNDRLLQGAPIEAVGVNTDRGVVVRQFPEQWRCRSCQRLTFRKADKCSCGSTSLAQMQFVAYHECGGMQAPYILRCKAHDAVALKLPGTTSARELYFYCPICKRVLSQGFPRQNCACGGGMRVNVHRAGVVFTPHIVSIVNPPDKQRAAELRAAGVGATALEWILDGIGNPPETATAKTYEGALEGFRKMGLSEMTALEMADLLVVKGEIPPPKASGSTPLPAPVRERAQEEALSVFSATEKGRVRVDDLVNGTTPPLQSLYKSEYLTAMGRASLAGVDLLTEFPIATLAFGYTREDKGAGTSRLVSFNNRGKLRVYGNVAKTEALLFRLNPLAVHAHLTRRGFALGSPATARDAHLSILQGVDVPRPTDDAPQPLGKELVTLLHSYGHRITRALAISAGIERDGLSEYLLPHLLSVIVFANGRGDFVLGGLQSVFEQSLHRVLDAHVYGESRCPLDPGCRAGGGACMACLHLGEPSCRWFNRYLNRDVLFGANGLLSGGSILATAGPSTGGGVVDRT